MFPKRTTGKLRVRTVIFMRVSTPRGFNEVFSAKGEPGIRGVTVIREDTRTYLEITGQARSLRYKRSRQSPCRSGRLRVLSYRVILDVRSNSSCSCRS
jgi:hypothetical protein